MTRSSCTAILRLVDAPQNVWSFIVIILHFRHGPFVARGFRKVLRIIELLAEGHGVANALANIATGFLAVAAVVVSWIVVHLLRILFEANHRVATVITCSWRFTAVEMPGAAIMGVRGGIATLHGKGVCSVPLERRGDSKGK